MLIECWFDGVCEPYNPGGHVAYGATVTIDGQVVFEEAKYVGVGDRMSCNVGEYSGIIAVLKFLQELEGPAVIRSDSKLVVEQLNGRWQVKKGFYVPYYREAKALWDQVRDRCQLIWIRREYNTTCDVLSKEVLKKMGVEFRIQPEDGSKPRYLRKPPARDNALENPSWYDLFA
jgi:ribonuclease HI